MARPSTDATMMRAVQISCLDGPGAVEVVDIPAPAPSEGQVLIDVRAAGVSFPEVLQSRGQYQIQPDLPFVPGAEVAGVVESAPDGSGLSVGQRVVAFTVDGGFAQRAIAPAYRVFPLPDVVSFEQGAALLVNYLTAHFALSARGQLAEGEDVLVHGAAGGVGTASIQIARALGAGRVVAVVSTQEKGRVALDAGATHYVPADGFLPAVRELTGGQGVDLVVDPVGGERFTDSCRALRAQGRLLVLGFTAGEIPSVRVNRLLLNNISVVGVGWGAFVLPRPDFLAAQWQALVLHLEAGTLIPPAGQAFALDDTAEALLSLAERRATGKVVLLP